jgi:hypothetical protein
MLVGVGSVKGSPGVTTVALGLASTWPGRVVLLMEVDPSGGDIGVWRGVGSDPGLVSLAGAARRDRAGGVKILDHAHELGPGLWTVPGPARAEQARAAVRLLADRPQALTTAAERLGAVVVDLGRLDPESPARDLLTHLDVLLLAARDTVGELTHLAASAPSLADAAGKKVTTGAVLTQGCRYRTREVEEALGVPLLAVLPPDPATSATLAGAPVRSRGLIRRPRTGPLLATLGELGPHLARLQRPRPRPAGPAVAAPQERPQLTAPGHRPAPAARIRRPRPAPPPVAPPAATAPMIGATREHSTPQTVTATPSTGVTGKPPASRPVPRTAAEAGWTLPAPADSPGSARPNGRRTS